MHTYSVVIALVRVVGRNLLVVKAVALAVVTSTAVVTTTAVVITRKNLHSSFFSSVGGDIEVFSIVVTSAP